MPSRGYENAPMGVLEAFACGVPVVGTANGGIPELIEAGVHFGHRASRWNPKMAPYIYARKNGIHIIDIRETIRGLLPG